MPEQAKTPGVKRGWLWLVVGALAITILLAHGLSSFFLQSKAGGRIARYVKSFESGEMNPTKGMFYCLLPSIFELPKSADLDQAIEWLNKAKSIAPWNEYSNFMLGQVYCLKGEYQKAVDELTIFVDKRNENRLGQAELGFAQLSLLISELTIENGTQELEIAQNILEDADFPKEFFSINGEKAYKMGNYPEALALLSISENLTPLNEANRTKLALLRIVVDKILDAPLDIPAIIIDSDLSEVSIVPSSFFQINDGKPAMLKKIGNNSAAAIYSNSSGIGVIVDVRRSSEYCLAISALDQKPEPTQMAVFLNFKKILEIELTNGNGQIKGFQSIVGLEEGISLISIKLLNDYYSPTEGDRNGYIASVSIKPCE